MFAKEGRGGQPRWAASSPTTGGYGPRGATTVDGDQVYALGAKGGLIYAPMPGIWQGELVEDLEGKVPGWGYTESVLVDGRFRLNHNPSAFRWWSGLVYFRSAFKPEPQACEISCSEAFFSPLFSKDNHEDKILFIQFK